MGTTPISLRNEAYKILKAQKREESFSDLILRKFGKGNPSAMLAYLKERDANEELADAIEKASKKTQKTLKLEKVKL